MKPPWDKSTSILDAKMTLALAYYVILPIIVVLGAYYVFS